MARRPRPPRPAVAWSQYLAARTVATILTGFDLEANLRTASLFGRVWHDLDRWSDPGGGRCRDALARLLRHRRARALAHLRVAFPDKPDRELDRIARGTFAHFMQLAIEVLHTPRLIHRDGWFHRVHLTGFGPALELLNAGRPVILITGHLGNWEVLGLVLSSLGYPLHAVARPIDNPMIDRWLLGIRQAHGLDVITKWDATEKMRAVLARGEPLAFIADQNAGDRGLFVPFFNRLASSYKIGLLAIEHAAPIVCGYAHRGDAPGTWDVGLGDVIYPDDWADQPDPLFYITARYQRAIEQMVRRRPEQYFWMHRRWKSRPAFERLGKPMPASLRAKLEALPWMDDRLMARLHEPVPQTA